MPSKVVADIAMEAVAGKVIVVTGATAGLGAESVRQFAKHNVQRIFVCARSPSKSEAFMAEIKEQNPSIQLDFVPLDLTNLQSTQTAAQQILHSTQTIVVLMLNAGIAGTTAGLTKDGYEEQFGVNYVAHAYFAQLLAPLLLETARFNKDVRVVAIASEAAGRFAPDGGLVLKDAKTDMKEYASMARYGHSKLAKILFVKKLAQLYPSITSVAVHPGLVKTGFAGKADGVPFMIKVVFSVASMIVGVGVQEGAKAQLWASSARNVHTGKYYTSVGVEDADMKHSNDQRLMDELWRWTNEELAQYGAPGWPAAR